MSEQIPATRIDLNEIASILNGGLDTSAIAWRKESWSSDREIPYLTAEYVISQANKAFGFLGWSYTVRELRTVCDLPKVNAKTQKEGFEIGIQCTLAVTVNIGGHTITREDVGYGSGIDYGSKATAFESAGKEAVSDALKRCMRTFGDQFGNCLYNKEYIAGLKSGGGQRQQPAQRQYNNTQSAPPAQNTQSAPPQGGGNTGGYASGKPLVGEASPAQKNAITKMLAHANKSLADFGLSDMNSLSKQKASEIISALQNK